MPETKRAVCPLDCPDTCSILATVDGGTKHSPEGRGINQPTSQKTTDFGGGSTFPCNLVCVSP